MRTCAVAQSKLHRWSILSKQNKITAKHAVRDYTQYTNIKPIEKKRVVSHNMYCG